MTDLEWTISLNRLMLKIIGLWPPDSQDAREVVQSKIRLLYNFITLLFILTLPALVSLIRVWGDMILVIDNLLYSLPLLMSILKICILWYKQEALKPLIDMITRDWLKVKVKEEHDVMLRHGKIIRMIAICGMSMIFFTLIITLVCLYFGLTIRHVTNLTDPGKPLIIQSYYLHDVSKSPQYELTIFAQIIVLFTTCITYSAVDTFLGLLVIHICGQLENLHSRLTHMNKYLDFNAALKYNVQDHIRLMRSIRIIDDAFDLMLLSLIFFIGMLFCLQGFLVINVVRQKGQFSFTQLGWFVAVILSMLLHICLYCAVGEVLATQSGKIHLAPYEYAWYTIKPQAAKDLMLITLRSSKPLCITAGKIFPMTMVTLCKLLKTSAGYISVLLANQG